jgi:hypothetical protein
MAADRGSDHPNPEVCTMTDKKDGGPAFPTQDYDGMSLRDWFAGQALNGLISASDNLEDLGPAVRLAYQLADDMLVERSDEEPQI